MKRLLYGVLLLLSGPVHAIVDVHDEYYSNSGAERFSVFGFDFSGATGNKEVHDFSLENHTMLRGNDSTILFVGEVEFAETNKVKSADSQFAHLRYVRNLSSPHGVEVYAQYGQDEFELLDRRVVLGGGYRFEWKEGTEDERGLFGVGVMREHERYTNLIVEQRLWRLNTYFTLATPLDLARGGSLSLSAYAQPSLEDFSDARAVAVTMFKVRLSESLSLKFSIDYKYDADPEPGIEDSNLSYSSGISYTIK
jgi:hypothetical protein